MKVQRYIGVWQVSAYGQFRSAQVSALALAACDAMVFAHARRQGVRVILPFSRLPFGMWCSIAMAARLLRISRRTLRDHAKNRELSYCHEGSRERILFVVAVKRRRSR